MMTNTYLITLFNGKRFEAEKLQRKIYFETGINIDIVYIEYYKAFQLTVPKDDLNSNTFKVITRHYEELGLEYNWIEA